MGLTISAEDGVQTVTQAMCLHQNTRFQWQPRGVDVFCPSCNTTVFVPRTKLLAYARGLLEQQFNATTYFSQVFNEALDSGNDVQATIYTDDARAMNFRGLVQKVTDKFAEMTVDVRGKVEYVLIPFRALLQATEIIPEVKPAEPTLPDADMIDEAMSEELVGDLAGDDGNRRDLTALPNENERSNMEEGGADDDGIQD